LLLLTDFNNSIFRILFNYEFDNIKLKCNGKSLSARTLGDLGVEISAAIFGSTHTQIIDPTGPITVVSSLGGFLF